MKIRMKQTQLGAADGVTTVVYEKGVEYELGESVRALDLALVFVGEGWAEEVRESAPVVEAEETEETEEAPAEPRAKGWGRKGR